MYFYWFKSDPIIDPIPSGSNSKNDQVDQVDQVDKNNLSHCQTIENKGLQEIDQVDQVDQSTLDTPNYKTANELERGDILEDGDHNLFVFLENLGEYFSVQRKLPNGLLKQPTLEHRSIFGY